MLASAALRRPVTDGRRAATHARGRLAAYFIGHDECAPRLPPFPQVTAELAAVPGAVLHADEIPAAPQDAARVLVARMGS
jgi:hypothetical protein